MQKQQWNITLNVRVFTDETLTGDLVIEGVEKRMKGILDTDIDVKKITVSECFPMRSIPNDRVLNTEELKQAVDFPLLHSMTIFSIDPKKIKPLALKHLEDKMLTDETGSKIISITKLIQVIGAVRSKRIYQTDMTAKDELTQIILGLVELQNKAGTCNFITFDKSQN